MPRPNPAQLAYGSATVILSALAMLLLSQTRSVVWIVVISCAALALGLLVAVTSPAGRPVHRTRPAAGTVPGPRGAARAEAGRRIPQTSSRR